MISKKVLGTMLALICMLLIYAAVSAANAG